MYLYLRRFVLLLHMIYLSIAVYHSEAYNKVCSCYHLYGPLMDGCGHCELKPHPSVEYRCVLLGTTVDSRACNAHEPIGTIVNPQCATNYYSPATLTYMQCLNGDWNYIAKCLPDCGRVTPDSMALVVGGQRVKKGQLPWHAGIYRKTVTPYLQICGGSLISTNVVISAAHCFWNDLEKQLPASQFAVAVGKLYRPWDDPMDQAQKSDVKVIHVPARYQGAGAHDQDDIAVVVSAHEFQFNTYIRPVCLNFDYRFEIQQLYPGNNGKVAGWGLTAANGNASSVLRVVDLPYVDIRTCIIMSPPEFGEYITSDKICAGTLEPNTALCRGDSGGGLAYSSSPMGVERYYLRGVVSTAPTSDSACNTAVYTSFTSITKHEQFIKQFWIESGEFRCQEGSFITATNYCDGARDCADGSDETEDACSTKICSDYLFRCAYGACVDRGATCNGVRDCADGSDEAAALCGEITTSKTETFYRSSEVSCTLPPYPEHGAYTTDVAGAEPGQGYERVTLSNVTCERGYAARGSISQEFSCSNGVWTESIPRCVMTCGGPDNVSGYEFSDRGHCYKFHTQAAYWADANRTCVAEGARLAVPNSEDEERVLMELFKDYPPEAILDADSTHAVSVGVYWETDGWRTVDGQTLAQAYTHAHWDAGNPTHEDNHPYVYMRRDGAFFNWHDDYQFAFVCEKEHNAT